LATLNSGDRIQAFTKKSLFEPRQDVTFFTFQTLSEITDLAAIKTIETAKTTNAEMVKINIKSGEVTLLVPPSGSKTTLALEIKLQQYVVRYDFANLSRSMLTKT
jgi:ABC-type glutathione transport system ATPase component